MKTLLKRTRLIVWLSSACRVHCSRPQPASSTSRRKPVRLGLVECSSDFPIRVDHLVDWALNTPDLERIGKALVRYPVLFKETFLMQKNSVSWSCERGRTVLLHVRHFTRPPHTCERCSTATVGRPEDRPLGGGDHGFVATSQSRSSPWTSRG